MRGLQWGLVSLLFSAAHCRIMWSGGLTPSSFIIAMEVFDTDADTTVKVSTSADLSSPVQTLEPSTSFFKWKVTGLTNGTTYYYGITGAPVGKATTPAVGSHSFSFAFASCAFTGYEHVVFEEIAALDANFFIHMGDIHYEDIAVNSEELRNQSFKDVFASETQSAMFRERPTVYMWDDHDFGDNNALGTFPGKPAAQAAYKTFVPHYPLETSLPDGPLYQAFDIGRVRFLLTDLRSDSSLVGAENSTMGATQREWLLSEIAQWQSHRLVVWVSTKPWQGTLDVGSDKWRGYVEERELIANRIAAMSPVPDNLVMISGDAHLLGADDGSHTDYSTNGGAGFPLFQAAPMVQYGSAKGTGPYVVGCTGYSLWIVHQYATMDIVDDGVNPVSFTWKGYEAEAGEVFSLELTVPLMKTGSPGGEPCTLPLVPGFMWGTVALQVLSVFGSMLACITWLTVRHVKIKAASSATADWKPATSTEEGSVGSTSSIVASVKTVDGVVTPPPMQSTPTALDDIHRFGGTMSVNPIHSAGSSGRRPTVTTLVPVGDDFTKHV